MNKYVYLIPRGGLNDILCRIKRVSQYCKRYNRILLIDTRPNEYNVNLSDVVSLERIDKNIIYDSYQIEPILNNEENTLFPGILNNNVTRRRLIENRFYLQWRDGYCNFFERESGVELSLPKQSVKETIIIHVTCGGGDGFPLLKSLSLCDDVKTTLQSKPRITNKYISIHIRNTDLTCDYEKLYAKNKEVIHKYKHIHIATDDIKALEFFKKINNLVIYNFTTFPTSNYRSLHYSKIDGFTKMVDLFYDMYLVRNCDIYLSNSKGGFTHLLKNCKDNKSDLKPLFDFMDSK